MVRLSSERDGKIFLIATGVPRHIALRISPKPPCKDRRSDRIKIGEAIAIAQFPFRRTDNQIREAIAIAQFPFCRTDDQIGEAIAMAQQFPFRRETDGSLHIHTLPINRLLEKSSSSGSTSQSRFCGKGGATALVPRRAPWLPCRHHHYPQVKLKETLESAKP
jgi:hypothetical protein